ncbi:prepilin-type N-terminal cleavage/methylation domain-containing protein [Candidatus Parcubacteria bacterium]|nr:prepilin-type N-terminal cleavage/methylation domain-containing protein [Candidatus Parcubacteria bacterium]
MINIKSCQRGQGLIEVIAAIAIITISLSAIISLIVIGLSANRESRCRVISTNLAREAIEVARNKRDSNWLDIEAGTAGADWDSALYDDDDYSAILKFDEGEENNNFDDWDFQFQPDNISDNDCKLYFKNGIYKQDKNVIIDGVLTKYSRLILLNPICELISDGSESIVSDGVKCNDIGGFKIGIQVISQVDWLESGREHSLLLEDRLYNWK